MAYSRPAPPLPTQETDSMPSHEVISFDFSQWAIQDLRPSRKCRRARSPNENVLNKTLFHHFATLFSSCLFSWHYRRLTTLRRLQWRHSITHPSVKGRHHHCYPCLRRRPFCSTVGDSLTTQALCTRSLLNSHLARQPKRAFWLLSGLKMNHVGFLASTPVKSSFLVGKKSISGGSVGSTPRSP